MIGRLTLGLALALALPAAAAAGGELRTHELADPNAYPESIGVDARTGAFFTGSVVDGAVYRGTLSFSHAELFLQAGSDGRSGVAGVKVDGRSRVWLADAYNGRVLVYSESGSLLHTFVLTGTGSPTVNDLAFSHGRVFVTDSARPFLYELREAAADEPGTTTVAPWISVEPTIDYKTGAGPLGVNLNGIVASPDGKTLLVVQTSTGILWRVDVANREITEVDTGGADLQFGDGLMRVGESLYVARNLPNQIVKLRIGRDWRSVEIESTTTNAAFAFPTALATLDGRLLVTNAQLNVAPNPQLPFTVVDLPLP